jgi:hypothetical protein
VPWFSPRRQATLKKGLRALSAQTARSDHENDSQLFDCRMADIRVRRRQQRFT